MEKEETVLFFSLWIRGGGGAEIVRFPPHPFCP